MKNHLFLRYLMAGAVVSGLLGGCVYYNGMYNANRLARMARKAEREGRTFEANGFWGQVATKAESVLVRHPTSKYAEQAGLLRGVALSRLGQCDQALGSLSRVAVTVTTSDLTEDALLAFGRCQAARGNLAAAGAAFSQLLQSTNSDRRREARFEHARLLRQTGQYREALTALSSIPEPRAEPERVLALAGAGRLPEALALTDSLIARGDTTKRWDSLLVILAQNNPSAASGLVDRILRLPNRTRDLQARLLLEDGLRLVSFDTARGARRFRETIATAGNGDAAGRAALALARLRLTGVSRPADLAAVMATLQSLGLRYGIVSEEISRFRAAVADVHTAATRVTPDSAQGDLRLFLAAEAARDSLAAPRLAEVIFRRIPEQWPLSPYAPKAILAAQQLNPAWADSARALLDEQYLASPYLSVIRGEASPEYRQLEDSLGAFAASLAVRRAPALRRRPIPTDVRRRPRPEAEGSRALEP